jgi:hypothetical protein
MGDMPGMREETKQRLRELCGRTFENAEELFAYAVTERLGEAYGFTDAYMFETIHAKPTAPEKFGWYMDHAYFSAMRLWYELADSVPPERFGAMHADVLTAILLHNSLFKFAVAFFKGKNYKRPLRMDEHPLAFLLMLCDELQCWDRTAYGRNSRTELHPMAASFDFSSNKITATYYYDKDEQEKIDAFNVRYKKWEDEDKTGGAPAPRLKAYSDMVGKEQRFTSDIEKITDLTEMPLTVHPETCAVDRTSKHTYLSTSNFVHLYDFAIALNARYNYQGREETVEAERLGKEFEELSLEYQLSNINQAKRFARYLDAVGCFYTDRPVDYEMISAFMKGQTDVFGPMEHERWIREHISMGWIRGDLYATVALPEEMISQYGDEKKARKALREQLRMHKLAMDGTPTEEEIFAHYEQLTLEDQAKDYEPYNSMLKLIRKFGGLRISRLD